MVVGDKTFGVVLYAVLGVSFQRKFSYFSTPILKDSILCFSEIDFWIYSVTLY
jgi:hypothetical protein